MTRQTGDKDKLLRMNELVKATGVPKSTILHYVREGLLPEPMKTSPNMAYYHPESVERVRFIKTLQARHGLPLAKIKRLMELRESGEDITVRLELLQGIFPEGGGRLLDREAFCRSTGLTSEQCDELTTAGLLLPLRPGLFDEEDAAVGAIFAEGLARGLKVEDFAFYPRLCAKIVDEEMRIRKRLTRDLPGEDDAGLTLRLLHAARTTRRYVIERIFQHRVAEARSPKDEELCP